MMLSRLTNGARRTAAGFIVLLYAVCLLMPPAAFAFGGGGLAHCLTVDGPAHVHGHDAAKMHVAAHLHADGSMRHHDGAGMPQKPAKSHHDDGTAGCCGLFCITAMAVEAKTDLGLSGRRSSILPISFEELAGRGPDRIKRPPKFPLAL